MELGDFANKMKPEAGTAVAMRETGEGLENPLALDGGDAGSLVDHVDGPPLSNGDGDRSMPTAMLDGILHEIGQRPFEASGIADGADTSGSVSKASA